MTSPYLLDNALLNLGSPETLWGNLGYWADDATAYPAACAALAHRLGQAAALHPDDHVLDASIGYGDQLKLWAETFGVRQIQGLDITPAHIIRARQRLNTWNLPAQIHLHLGNAAYPALKPTQFDKILSLDSAYHYAPRTRFFQASHSLLKPGGRLALTDLLLNPTYPQPTPALIKTLGRLAAIPPQNWRTPTQYRAELAAHGYRQIHLTYLDQAVFPGFARFILNHARIPFLAHPDPGLGQTPPHRLPLRPPQPGSPAPLWPDYRRVKQKKPRNSRLNTHFI